MASTTLTSLQRHKHLSHFYDLHKRDHDGHLLNDRDESLLQSLGFTTYRDLAGWLSQEFWTEELNWRTLNAGSTYPIALPVVVQFLGEVLPFFDLATLIPDLWHKLSSRQQKQAFRNMKHIFGNPELYGRHSAYCAFVYKVFIAGLRKN